MIRPTPSPETQRTPTRTETLTANERRRLHRFTPREMEIAQEAAKAWLETWPVITKGNGKGRASGGGYGPHPKYTGRTAMQIIERAVPGWRRQLQLAHLVIAMGREAIQADKVDGRSLTGRCVVCRGQTKPERKTCSEKCLKKQLSRVAEERERGQRRRFA